MTTYATLNLRDSGGANGYLTKNVGQDNQSSSYSVYCGTANYDHPIRACIQKIKAASHASSIRIDLWEVYDQTDGSTGQRVFFGENIDDWGKAADHPSLARMECLTEPERKAIATTFSIPGTSYMVEVSANAPAGEKAFTHVKLRDVTIPKPAFDPVNYLNQIDYNVVLYQIVEADTTPTP